MIYMIYKGIKLVISEKYQEGYFYIFSTYVHKNLRHWNHCLPDIYYNHLCHRISSSCQCSYQFYIRILYSLEMKNVRNIRMKYWCSYIIIIRNSTFFMKKFTRTRICVTIFQFSWFSGTRPSEFLWFRYSSCSVSSSSTARLRTWAIVPWCPLTIN